MSSDEKDSGWANFEQFFSSDFPLKGMGGLQKLPVDLGSIHSYVKNVVSKATQFQDSLSSEVFETHHFIIVRFNIPSHIKLTEVRVLVNSQHVKLDNLPGGKEKLVQLPKRVLPRKCRALYKRGILQIKVPIEHDDEPYREIYIRY